MSGFAPVQHISSMWVDVWMDVAPSTWYHECHSLYLSFCILQLDKEEEDSDDEEDEDPDFYQLAHMPI